MKNFGAHLRSHGAILDIRSVYSSFLQNASEFLALDALPIRSPQFATRHTCRCAG